MTHNMEKITNFISAVLILVVGVGIIFSIIWLVLPWLVVT